LLLLLVEVKEYDLEIDDALVNLDVYDEEVLEVDVDATDLTFVGLTHSAWWERSLVLEMGLSQNSQGIMTTSSLELLSVTLLVVTTSAAVADLDRLELVTRLMLLDLLSADVALIVDDEKRLLLEYASYEGVGIDVAESVIVLGFMEEVYEE